MRSIYRRAWQWLTLVSLLAVSGMAVLSVADGHLKPGTDLVVPAENLPEVSQHPVPSLLHSDFTTARKPSVIWLVRQPDGTYRALSNQTAHPRGCSINWYPDSRRFVDPCLGSVFDRTGLNVAGPAPRGLDSYVVRAAGRILEIDLSRTTPVRQPHPGG